MSESLLWIRREIQRFENTATPVSAILQVSISTTDEMKGDSARQKTTHQRLMGRVKIALELLRAVGCPFPWFQRPSPNIPVHFITCAAFSDLVKARVMKRFFIRFNRVNNHLGKVTFLMSRPLEYLHANADDEIVLHDENGVVVDDGVVDDIEEQLDVVNDMDDEQI